MIYSILMEWEKTAIMVNSISISLTKAGTQISSANPYVLSVNIYIYIYLKNVLWMKE